MRPEQVCDLLVSLRQQIRVRTRLVFADGRLGDWSDWLISPAKGYLETSGEGPWRLVDIAAVDVDPVEVVRTGKYASDIKTDRTQTVRSSLASLDVRMSVNADGTIRVKLA